jgi:hypothetical protein
VYSFLVQDISDMFFFFEDVIVGTSTCRQRRARELTHVLINKMSGCYGRLGSSSAKLFIRYHDISVGGPIFQPMGGNSYA